MLALTDPIFHLDRGFHTLSALGVNLSLSICLSDFRATFSQANTSKERMDKEMYVKHDTNK